jgi:hypothetical protein
MLTSAFNHLLCFHLMCRAKGQQSDVFGKQDISMHDEQNDLETLNDTESDEVAAAKKALALEIRGRNFFSVQSRLQQQPPESPPCIRRCVL